MPASPLIKKLRIQPGPAAVVLNAPAGFMESLGDLPEGVDFQERPQGEHNFVLLFVKDSVELKKSLPVAMKAAAYDGMFWIAYPKQSSKVDTDLNRDILWERMRGSGIRPVSLVSIDRTWSAMRFRPEEKVKTGK